MKEEDLDFKSPEKQDSSFSIEERIQEFDERSRNADEQVKFLFLKAQNRNELDVLKLGILEKDLSARYLSERVKLELIREERLTAEAEREKADAEREQAQAAREEATAARERADAQQKSTDKLTRLVVVITVVQASCAVLDLIDDYLIKWIEFWFPLPPS